ncbi:hypothetical protein [Brevundimonas sp. LM2]|uniref:hypothetical protein n=1 Tax=Brevundimonas sp. LM2 TaxID=1938605 RepID=UPI0012376E37|nr:hypothetical protein [Brevundimonas sp. LM2]
MRLLLWSLVWLVGLVAIGLVMIPIIMPYAGEIQSAQGNASALSPQASTAIATAMFAAFPIGLLVQSVLAPAVYRAVLQPDAGWFGGLQLGRDELRILVVTFVLGLLSLALNAGGDLLSTAVTRAAGGLLGSLIGLIASLLTIWVSVRLSLIAPETFRQHRISFAAGWALTGKHFWPLLGMMVVTIIMAALVVLLLVVVAWPLMLVVNAAAASGAGAAAGGLLSVIVILALVPLGMTLVSVLLWAPFAAAARDIATGR